MKRLLFTLISMGCLASGAWARPFNWEPGRSRELPAFQNCQDAQAAWGSARQSLEREAILKSLDTLPQEFCWELLLGALNDENFFVRERVHALVLQWSLKEQVEFVQQALSSDQDRVVISTIQLIKKLSKDIQAEYSLVLVNLIRYTPSDAVRIETYAYLMDRDPALLRPILKDVNPAISKLAMYFLQHQQQRQAEAKAMVAWAADQRPDLYSDVARDLEVEKLLADLARLPNPQPVWLRLINWIKDTVGKVWLWVLG